MRNILTIIGSMYRNEIKNIFILSINRCPSIIKFNSGWDIRRQGTSYLLLCPCNEIVYYFYPLLEQWRCSKHKGDSIPIEVITTFNLLQ
jgi:hypothetical protein